ncbi:MAG: phosphoribosyltransferase [Spiroplasma sp.]
MNISEATNFRMVKQLQIEVPCYFYGYFKSPGLKSYPEFKWVNNDFNLIKTKNLDEENCYRIASNLFFLGQKFNLFQKVDYFVMMPLKTTSVSSLEKVILKLISLIEDELAIKIKLIDDLFLIEDYRKFWENRLKFDERKKEIANKITLKQNYYHFFNEKKIFIIDDVISTGTSIAEVALILKKFNDKLNITALTYGSVYQWENIYI